jgi:hypothetical protein
MNAGRSDATRGYPAAAPAVAAPIDDHQWQNDSVMLPTGVVVPVRATARRRTWQGLPAVVQTAIEYAAGSPVVTATTTGTGFTAGFASRLDLADGSACFVKAASTRDDRLHGWQISSAYRIEARNLRLLPSDVGAIPLSWSLDVDDEDDAWIVLGFPYIHGHPPRRPWRPQELRLVTDKLAQVAPALARAPQGLDLEPYDGDRDQLPAWIARVLERDGESRWLDAIIGLAGESVTCTQGTAVAHLDLRDDNIVLGDDGSVWICDWNWPMLAAPWLDLVTVLIAAYGDGLDTDTALCDHPLTAALDPRSVDAWLANLWLYLTTRMEGDVPAGSPHLRDHQAWYEDVTRRWLEQRIGISARVDDHG